MLARESVVVAGAIKKNSGDKVKAFNDRSRTRRGTISFQSRGRDGTGRVYGWHSDIAKSFLGEHEWATSLFEWSSTRLYIFASILPPSASSQFRYRYEIASRAHTYNKRELVSSHSLTYLRTFESHTTFANVCECLLGNYIERREERRRCVLRNYQFTGWLPIEIGHELRNSRRGKMRRDGRWALPRHMWL